MWLCLNNSFVSIVEDRNDERFFLVRGRRKKDVAAFLGRARGVKRTPNADYLYRARVPYEDVRDSLMRALAGVTYPNFKDSVKDPDLKRMYSLWWSDHLKLQPVGKYVSGGPSGHPGQYVQADFAEVEQ